MYGMLVCMYIVFPIISIIAPLDQQVHTVKWQNGDSVSVCHIS